MQVQVHVHAHAHVYHLVANRHARVEADDVPNSRARACPVSVHTPRVARCQRTPHMAVLKQACSANLAICHANAIMHMPRAHHRSQ